MCSDTSRPEAVIQSIVDRAGEKVNVIGFEQTSQELLRWVYVAMVSTVADGIGESIKYYPDWLVDDGEENAVVVQVNCTLKVSVAVMLAGVPSS